MRDSNFIKSNWTFTKGYFFIDKIPSRYKFKTLLFIRCKRGHPINDVCKGSTIKIIFQFELFSRFPRRNTNKIKSTEKLQKQGYDITEEDDFNKVYSLKIRDRKQEFEEANEDENSELLNKFVLDDVKSKSLPQVILRRQASIDASMGASIKSGDISVIPALTSGDDVLLMDKHYNIVAHGVANLSSEEIKDLPEELLFVQLSPAMMFLYLKMIKYIQME